MRRSLDETAHFLSCWRRLSSCGIARAVVRARRSRRTSCTAVDNKSAPPKPAPRLGGHPDLSGYWKGTRDTRPGGNIGKDLPGFKLPLTPAGEAALQHNLTATIDPESLCIIGGIPRHNASGLPFEVLQGANKVVFMYLVQLLPSDPGRRQAEALRRSRPVVLRRGDRPMGGRHAGRSTPSRFKDERVWIDENANPHSDALHVVERWTRPDLDHIHVETLIEDPKFYTRPFTYSRTWVLGKPDEQIQEYSCSENNVDRDHLGFGPGPIRADGTRGYDNWRRLPPPIPRTPAPPK